MAASSAFTRHVEAKVGCTQFAWFSHIAERNVRYGDVQSTLVRNRALTPSNYGILLTPCPKLLKAANPVAGRSLLPSGIAGIEGDFTAGDAVQIRRGDALLGQGLSSYRAQDLQRIAGKRSDEISGILGAKPFDEAIHRDQLVLQRA